MKLRVLGCSGGSAPGRRLSGFLLDDVLAVDAGSLTTGLDLDAQLGVEVVLLTHAHLDHCWCFPLFLANRFTEEPKTVALHGSTAALDAVRTHLFNDAIWPHDDKFSVRGIPLVTWHPMEDGEEREVLPGWEITTVGLHHTVPSQAFLVRRRGDAIMMSGDTGPTDELWKVANATADLRGIVIECSFPDTQADLAKLSGHLTPTTLARELAKFEHGVPVLVTHIKPECRHEVIAGLHALEDDRIRILEDGQVHVL
ncbi:MAG: MBL fold metallo-hydrolase [Planctomycetota bacterium]|jgi:3',5'-cyclic-nucleotide phosphodiesterase